MVFTMEDLCNHINRAGKYGCSSTSSTYAQSLSEMDFERGIWQAALDGDVNRVRKLFLTYPLQLHLPNLIVR